MTNGGPSLHKWETMIKDKDARMRFMIMMLKQIIPGLERIHSFGYSHADLKTLNICARSSSD